MTPKTVTIDLTVKQYGTLLDALASIFGGIPATSSEWYMAWLDLAKTVKLPNIKKYEKTWREWQAKAVQEYIEREVRSSIKRKRPLTLKKFASMSLERDMAAKRAKARAI